MYAHEVFIDIKKQQDFLKRKFNPNGMKNLIENSLYHRILNNVNNDIHNAQKFHIGEYRAIEKLLPFHEKTDTFQEYRRVPYDLCWFDYSLDKRKSAILVKRIYKNLVFILSFNNFSKESNTDPWNWEMSEVAYYTSLCDPIDKYAENIRIIHKDTPILRAYTFSNKKDSSSAFAVALYSIDLKNKDRENRILQAGLSDVQVMNGTISLLNCKNISTEIQPLNRKQTKKIKKSDLSAFYFHTLKVELFGQHKNYKIGAKTGQKYRLHLQRGHFKKYTAEAPLFGKYVGLYWWQPHVRGQNHSGVVMKDYEIDHKRED